MHKGLHIHWCGYLIINHANEGCDYDKDPLQLKTHGSNQRGLVPFGRCANKHLISLDPVS